jgi:ABC-type microcin C transport system permease subunit YejB
MSLCGGAFLLGKGLSFTSDKAWKEHVQRCAAKGLHPERNAYWERSARNGRIMQVIAGVALSLMGIILASTLLSSPF